MSTELGAADRNWPTIHTRARPSGDEGRRLRYMQEDGRFPVVFQKAPGDWVPYLMDIFTTLVEIRWRVMLLIFSLSYVLTWLFFGLWYWLIAYVNGDADKLDESRCVANVRGFTGAFMFSVETQSTIGYGYRTTTENCMGAIILVTAQDLFSCALDTVVIGVVAAKMASARKRAQTVGFSKCAVVNLRDGVLCLSWRLGDFRGNHVLEGVASAQVVRYVKQPRGSIVVSYQDLKIHNQDLVLATPVAVIHKLAPGSPLYGMTPDRPLGADVELVVSFTYSGDSTGTLHQTRASYTAADVRWGQRFRDMVRLGEGHYEADYALFNETTWVPVPLLSAEERDRWRRPAGGAVAPSVRRKGRSHQVDIDITPEAMQHTYL
ncbi:inward rectifier potassium channel 16-like [Betta splendens]|uniref:Inward rectifier potassium channel 16-like n=1 Tax=Betta splendens TaxID=158456 RepID=A0A6P7N863_BETSP|nr:inward rectifier potassium channel 16-like [Betta splendens]XP_055366908.1 inward rectifier potassium channel 16-like [Betta splendens]XP_055366909.1 inward rectifier potassium channel 16-like [Betta splendens]XP_055366910.1 inward rectifier potassium channel 16-like [Betta splendens]